jgi:hypothetical protein
MFFSRGDVVKCGECKWYSKGLFNNKETYYCIGSPESESSASPELCEIGKIHIEGKETWYLPHKDDTCVIKYNEELYGFENDK